MTTTQNRSRQRRINVRLGPRDVAVSNCVGYVTIRLAETEREYESTVALCSLYTVQSVLRPDTVL